MTSLPSSPLVTLGVAVYNEEAYLAETLENLAKQTYPNLEIILADNGSTDATQKLCEAFTATHANAKYVRHPKNIGQNANFNYLPQCGSGQYFVWISGHDTLDPTFVEDCVNVLESDANIVLAYPRTMNTMPDGTHTREKARRFDITKMSPQRRFREVMWRVDCNYVYGMWRLSPMLDSKLFQFFPAPDRVFLSEMAVKGTFAPVDTFKYYRANRGIVLQPEMEKRHRLMLYLFPHRRFTDAELAGNEFYAPTLQGFYRVAKDAPWGVFTRLRVYGSVWLCGVLKFHLFPGADAMSNIVKKLLPQSLLRKLMGLMQ